MSPMEGPRCPETFGAARCTRIEGHDGVHHGSRHVGWEECRDCVYGRNESAVFESRVEEGE